MAKPSGFLDIDKQTPKKRLIDERIKDFKEVELDLSTDEVKKQATRCMDCGTPFCHDGCPLGNLIPDFNDAVQAGHWGQAYEILTSTNNFPEFTGRICPAPCESSCVLGINKPPVTIEHIEKSIIEYAFRNGLVKIHKPVKRNGKKVAVIGSGPAGLAAADQLNQVGHTVTVFEKSDQIGGLLRYGIPDFKLEKWVIDRRLRFMTEEGIIFKTHTEIGKHIKASDLLDEFDAVLLCIGAVVPKDMETPGRHLKGIHFAMDYLSQQNARVNHYTKDWESDILATSKNVVVIGGGDTGSDCVGTANRQGATSITQIQWKPAPPEKDNPATPWPMYPSILRTSTSHEEGCNRQWSWQTKAFIGDENNNLIALKVVELDWKLENNKMVYFEKPETEQDIPCELALIATGFMHPEQEGLLTDLGVELDARGNVKATDFQTSVEKVFAAGDARMGQSLVVWAISEGREAAREIDIFLTGETHLEAKAKSAFAIV
ncbi:MAG: glutamate synthase subunit beta [Verrucomicrobia bacterium]|nr:glutamate synthase subunit beta [Cytophagales bacterium]